MALAARVKAKEGEKLDDNTVARVVELLERAVDPINKKQACEILNISYNTARLAKIIENYRSTKEMQRKAREANRGKPARPEEIEEVIRSYFKGWSISEIADSLFRPAYFVKNIVETLGIPQKSSENSYFNPSLIPEACVSDTFRVGQIVWSAKHQSMAMVEKLETNVRGEVPGANYYKIYVIEPIEEPSPWFRTGPFGGFYSGAYAYDLGNLDHLNAYGIDVYAPYKGNLIPA